MVPSRECVPHHPDHRDEDVSTTSHRALASSPRRSLLLLDTRGPRQGVLHTGRLPLARPWPPSGGLAHGPHTNGEPMPPARRGACTRAGQPRMPACDRLERPCTTREPVPPAVAAPPNSTYHARTTTHDDEKDAACPHGHKAGDADRWGTAELGSRPGNGVPSSFLLPCERGAHSQTVVITRPRLSPALWLLHLSMPLQGGRPERPGLLFLKLLLLRGWLEAGVVRAAVHDQYYGRIGRSREDEEVPGSW